ncbi:hypothetical protein NLI96_g6748 [Meripilus lineatus]|uniref:Uncharacterized protein n=1 Tax=Meripilus lineatus TaxID=2056292 RepID=A0AAD5V262_9APHY|nr:hypothetical protein NLI96_g6748 [Physisporinus lineatus]
MPSHTMIHTFSAALAGLGYNPGEDLTPQPESTTSLPSMLSTKSLPLYLPSHKLSQYSKRQAINILSPIHELPAMERDVPRGIQVPNLYSTFDLPDTPLDRSDPISQFVDALRERALEYLERLYSPSPYVGSQCRSDSPGISELSHIPQYDGDHDHYDSSYFASWEEDDGADEFDPTSSIIPKGLADLDDDKLTPSAASYTKVPLPTPSVNGPRTRAAGVVSNHEIVTPGAPRLEAAPFPWPSQLPTNPGDGIQGRFDGFLDGKGWITRSASGNGDDHLFISAYSTSSDSWPSSPPLSEDEGNDADEEILREFHFDGEN